MLITLHNKTRVTPLTENILNINLNIPKILNCNTQVFILGVIAFLVYDLLKIEKSFITCMV